MNNKDKRAKIKDGTKKILSSVLIALLGGVIAVGAYKLLEERPVLSIVEQQKAQFASLKSPNTVSSAGNVDFTQAAARVTPAVVYIETTYPMNYRRGGNAMPDMGDFFDDFFGRPTQPQQQRRAPRASGSGVIITNDGYIVTNNHVVVDAEKVQVTLEDQRTYTAEVIGRDPSSDLALIKIDAEDLPFVPYGNSDAVRVGEWVLAVGNPFNLKSTVTAGIVSAKARNIGILASTQGMSQDPQTPQTAAIEAFIQTDAVINKGNSGGALVNTNGELIGINSAIISHTGSYEGYGFAVPVSLVKKVVDDLLKFGKVQRGYIGVTFSEISPELADEKGLTTNAGLLVRDVLTDGAADEAGIEPGDVIIDINGSSVGTTGQMMAVVGRFRPGDKLKMTVLRDGNEKTMNVILKNADKTTEMRKAPEAFVALGAEVRELSKDEMEKLRTPNGVMVTDIDQKSALYRYTQIREGFVITEVNGSKVSSESSIGQALKKSREGMASVKGFYPNQPGLYTFTFPVK